jgi:hypothetical protein
MTNGSDTTPTFERLLAVSPHKRSGLILCKTYHAEFAGPGAMVCSPAEHEYTAVIAIGSPELVEVVTYEKRQQAYGRRIQWIRWLHTIVKNPEPVQRAEKLCSSFEEFFGSHVLVAIPDDILALLAGVLPETIKTVRSQHRYLQQLDEYELMPLNQQPDSDILVLDPRTLQALPEVSITTLPITGSAAPTNQLPCMV